MTHICVSILTIIGSDNGSAPGRRQTIIWTNDGILLIGPLGTNFSEILIEIQTFSFKKMRLKMSYAKWRPFCLGLNVLMHYTLVSRYNLACRNRSDGSCNCGTICIIRLSNCGVIIICLLFDTLKPRQNGRQFVNFIFKFIYMCENYCISIQILLKLIPRGPIYNKRALVQIITCHWTGHKPSSESMIILDAMCWL